MHIWLICQFFAPEPGAPSARLGGFARVWQDDGHKVSVLTALPNHPTGQIMPGYTGRGRYFQEDMAGLTVFRHWLYMTANRGFARKILSHLSFALSVLLRHLVKTPAEKPDVIVVSSPTFFAVGAAWVLSLRYRVPFVFEVRDLWPGIFVELGVLKPGLTLRLLEKVELFLYRRAAAVVTVTRGFARNIAERGIKADKLFVITNGVADNELALADKTLSDGSVDKLRAELQINQMSKVLLYIGTHGTSQALGQIIDAARLLMTRNDVVFLFVGDGADKARLETLARGMPNVHFLPAQPKEKVWAFYNLAYACFVPLKDTPGFATFIPSKMFEVMAARTAVIGCVAGEAAQILEAGGGAIVVPPEQPEKLAKAVAGLINSPERAEQMGEAGRTFVTKQYLHSALARQYLGVLGKVSKGRG